MDLSHANREEVWIDGPLAPYGEWNKYYPPPMQPLSIITTEPCILIQSPTISSIKQLFCCCSWRRKGKPLENPVLHSLGEYFPDHDL